MQTMPTTTGHETTAPAGDRARRRIIICSSCGEEGAHRGHGWCVACYNRWVYHGRPDTGPPAPGATPAKPRTVTPKPIPEECGHGHRLDERNLRFNADGARECRACSRESGRAYNARRLAATHAGHELIETRDGRHFCRTCHRGAQDVDEMAIVRAVAGDPPARLSPAERRAAVLELRALGLTLDLTAQRIGCARSTAWRWTKDAATDESDTVNV